MKHSWSNWSGRYSCSPANIYYPKSIEELCDIVNSASSQKDPIKCVGHGNSYTPNFHTDGHLISLKHMNNILDIDSQAGQICFEGGLSVKDLVKVAADKGLGISSLGTTRSDNFAGACFTGHHGSGIDYGILSSYLESFDLLLASGNQITLKKGDPLFDALGVNIGVAGIVTKLTLNMEPRFKLRSDVFPIKFEDLSDYFPSFLYEYDHLKFIWAPHTSDVQCWGASRVREPNSDWKHFFKRDWIDGMGVNTVLHGLGLYLNACFGLSLPKINRWLSQRLLQGEASHVSWSEDIFYLPHALKQDAVEYAIPIASTIPFLDAFKQLIQSVSSGVQFPIEVRFVKQDSFWLSPAYKQDMCYVGTKSHMLPFLNIEYEDYFKRVNALVESFSGRPHWGKQHYSSLDYLESVYPRYRDFWALQHLLDPDHQLMNAWAETLCPDISADDMQRVSPLLDEVL